MIRYSCRIRCGKPIVINTFQRFCYNIKRRILIFLRHPLKQCKRLRGVFSILFLDSWGDKYDFKSLLLAAALLMRNSCIAIICLNLNYVNDLKLVLKRFCYIELCLVLFSFVGNHIQLGSDDMETIGQRIKYLRDSLKQSQQQIAEKTGISRGNISNYEKDRVSPAADTIVALCAYFHVSADWLLTGKETVSGDSATRENYTLGGKDVFHLSEEFEKKAVYMKTTEEEERLILMYRDFSREDKDFILNMIQFKHEQAKRDEKKKHPSSS